MPLPIAPRKPGLAPPLDVAVPVAAPVVAPVGGPVAAPVAAPVKAGDLFVDDPGGNSPAAKLWNRYQPQSNDALGRSMERALTVISGLEPYLNNQDPLAPATNGIRTQLFSVEGMFRIYSGKYPELKQSFAEVKALEDAIGAFAQPSTAPEHEAAVARLSALVKEKWMPDPLKQGQVPALSKMVSVLAKQKFGTADDDRKFMQGALIQQVKDIGEKTFNMGELQGNGGIHELRRQLRWVSYYTQLAGLGGGPQGLLPASLTSSFSAGHDELGGIKDKGEQAEKAAREKVLASGNVLTFEAARAIVDVEMGPSYTLVGLQAEAKKVYDRIKRDYAENKDKLVVA